MKELHSSIEIMAPAAQVWQVLTDFASYPDWNPFIRSLSGELAVGVRLAVRIQPPGQRGMTFRPRLRVVQPGSELRWLGHLLIPGLFDGEHVFLIEPLGEGQVRFRQEETFRGVLVPLLWRSLGESTARGFEQMNRALKERAEGPFPLSPS
jgi:hypothetical protein